MAMAMKTACMKTVKSKYQCFLACQDAEYRAMPTRNGVIHGVMIGRCPACTTNNRESTVEFIRNIDSAT